MIEWLLAVAVVAGDTGASGTTKRPAAPSATSPSLLTLAPGIDLLPGTFVPGTQPDGNSVVLAAPEGLIVIDTGRHATHTGRLLDLAAARGRPIAAVLNTHWHLDHVGGNPRIRAAHPAVRVHASDAIRAAMTGFLARYRVHLEEARAKAEGDAEKTRPLSAELAVLDAGPALYPDVPVTAPGQRTIAGRRLELGLEKAVTAGDVWVFDKTTGVLVAGDLVTLPVPFLDTACPSRWRDALDRLSAIPFKQLVPGHGPVLTPARFASYRKAFGGLLDCAASTKTRDECATAWIENVGDLVPEADHAFTRSLLDYYFQAHLRADPGRTQSLCAVEAG